MQTEKLIGIGATGLAALGLGVTGASFASADDSPSTGSSSTRSTQGSGDSQGQQATKGERPAPVDDGRELSADAASKAITAAQGKEADAAVKGVHLGRDGGYDVMMLRTDGTMVEVTVDDSFTVTGVEERDGRGGPGGPRGGPGGHGAPGQAPGSQGSSGEDSDDAQQEAPSAPQGEQDSSPSASSTAS